MPCARMRPPSDALPVLPPLRRLLVVPGYAPDALSAGGAAARQTPSPAESCRQSRLP